MDDNTTVLVTGSNSGFGRLTAETLARRGCRVFASMRQTTGKNSPAAEELGQLALTENLALTVLDLDVTDEASVQTAVDRVVELTGRLDVVVNNAGVVALGFVEGFSTEAARRIFDVNVHGPLRLDRAALPVMRKQGTGLLIHVTSTIGRFVFPFMALYCASKFALEGLAEGLHYEVSPFGIDSIIVEPGAFPTGLMVKAIGMDQPERIAEYGSVAELPATLSENIDQLMADAQLPDPQEVADTITKLVDTPAGTRPLRTVVDPHPEGVEKINTVTAKVQRQIMQLVGMEKLMGVSS